MAKRIKVRPGIRYRLHETRKHGVGFDRYWSIYYKLDGKTVEEGLGWSSKGWTEKKAAGLLSELQENQRRGERPFTLREKREMEQAEHQAKKDQEAESEKSAITVNQFWKETYLPDLKANKRPGTVKSELSLYATWIQPALGTRPLVLVGTLDVERVKRNMQKEGRASSTIRTALAVVRQLFNMARRHKLYSGENPVKEVRFPKADNRRTRFLSQEEAAQLLAALWKTSPDVHDQALFSLGSGARFSELANLTWKDVDLDRGEALLTGIDRTGKSGKSRTVPLTVEVLEMLKRRKPDVPEGQSLVFPSRTGEPMGQVSASFMRTVDALGWNKGIADRRQKIVFHTLRHSYCSWLAMAGVPLYTLAQLSGHETMSMVQRYSHLSPGTLREAVSTLNGSTKPKKAAEVVELNQ